MRSIVICCMLGVVNADLRQAAWPKRAYKLRQDNGGRGGQNFVAATSQTTSGAQKTGGQKGVVMYAEPTTANYQGLKNQRANNYDNFLRSNIDNEQDNRNFNNEAGLDMQPFRTCESQAPLSYPYNAGNANGKNECDGSLQNVNNNNNMNPVLRAAPGEPRMTPLRWNNPHASEIEVNLWIMASDPPTIVPIKKPTCSGEGNQNNILQWAIPADFNQIDWTSCSSTNGKFNGCKQPGDCMLQIYAHSVETRQYSSATPIVITEGAYNGQQLQYNPEPKDAAESNSFVYPSNFDMESMILGEQPGNPAQQGNKLNNGKTRSVTPVNPEQTLKVCASSERNGVAPNGDVVDQVELKGQGATYETLNAPNVNLYLCKRNDDEIQAEQEVKSVKFEVFNLESTGEYKAVGEREENYSPFEYSSSDHFGGPGVKQIKATISLYTGIPLVKTVFLDLRGPGKRWRFRRHLLPACPQGLTPPKPDVRFNLGALKRETCLPSTDPNANYQRTTLQRAVLHSDVANHAYQNSDYSPYMGQQAGEISRTLQAASVIHMTSGNRGELGQNMIPNRVKNLVAQLNNKVNNIYQNYEKVANKIIDELSDDGGKDGQNANVGAQSLGTAFRAEAKGATSTKRLKTTTYVPSFSVAGYNMNTIQDAIASRTKGNRNSYKDILTEPNPTTGQQYVMIYTSTLYRMLPDFQKAAKYGVTYQASIEKTHCDVLPEELRTLSTLQGAGTQPADNCCRGSLQNTQAGGCGATFNSLTDHKKRNAAGKKDGGLYAASTFLTQHYRTMYNCPEACIRRTENSNILAEPLMKTSKGTCVTAINANTQRCVATSNSNSDIDCSGCACIYDNADPSRCANGWGNGQLEGVGTQLPPQEISIRSIQAPPPPEPEGNVAKAEGFGVLNFDDTAKCHTKSKFNCGELDSKDFLSAADVEVLADEKTCKETPSKRIDDMCRDSPCDADSESAKCVQAKSSCQYDPESNAMCQPGIESDPCSDCVCSGPLCSNKKYAKVASAGNGAYLALTAMIVLAAML